MMSTIVEENLISFKELEKKFFNMYVNLDVRLPGLSWSPTIKSLQHPGIHGSTVIRVVVKPV